MRALGFVFVGLCLVGLGIAMVKFGWFDYIVYWLEGLMI